MPPTRRTFIRTLGATALGLAAGRRALLAAAATHSKLKRIGIQLYTLRDEVSKDLGGVLARLAQIGYKEVEFAGYGAHTAAEIRALLRKNGLTAPSAHIALSAIEKDPKKTFRDAKTVGHQWITVPSPPGRPQTADDWKRIAEQFNRVGARVKAAGLRFAYHNHNAELKKVGDVVPLELLLKETDPALVSYEMDIYWVVNGGGDPLELLARYPGRFKMFHVKDSMGAPDHKMADVGAGTIDFKTIFARAKGIQHYFVEHDESADPFASAKASYDYLARLEF